MLVIYVTRLQQVKLIWKQINVLVLNALLIQYTSCQLALQDITAILINSNNLHAQ